jgi:hypothetical protein
MIENGSTNPIRSNVSLRRKWWMRQIVFPVLVILIGGFLLRYAGLSAGASNSLNASSSTGTSQYQFNGNINAPVTINPQQPASTSSNPSAQSNDSSPCAVENAGNADLQSNTFNGYPCNLNNEPGGNVTSSGNIFNR